MDRYRKLKVIGKGSFGYAVQVQSVADRHTYVMKVQIKPPTAFWTKLLNAIILLSRSSTSLKWTESNARTPLTR